MKKRLTRWLVGLSLGVAAVLGMKAPMSAKADWPGKWEQTDEGWKYKYTSIYDGVTYEDYMESDFLRLGDGKKYYFNEDGIMQTGWISKTGYRFYANASGEIQKGWQTIDGVTYFFYTSGVMATDAIIDNTWVVDEDGVYVGRAGEWKSDGNGWWYQYRDGSYPKNDTVYIDGYLYAFGKDGYMYTGWTKIDYESGETSDWIYSAADGRVVTGWQQIDGTWYYFWRHGTLAVDTVIDGIYAVDESGAYTGDVDGWKKDGDKWWYSCRQEYYDYETEEMYWANYPSNCAFTIDGTLYFFDADGYMQTGWIDAGKYWGIEETQWYYRYADGSYPDWGWHQVEGQWYFFQWDGMIATNCMVDGYVFDENGSYRAYDPEKDSYFNEEGKWSYDGKGWKYVFEDGFCLSGGVTWVVDGCVYAFDNDGYMLTGWVDDARYADYSYHQESAVWYYFESDGKAAQGWRLIDGSWYYFTDGYMQYSCVIDGYYLGADGAMTDMPSYVEY